MSRFLRTLCILAVGMWLGFHFLVKEPSHSDHSSAVIPPTAEMPDKTDPTLEVPAHTSAQAAVETSAQTTFPTPSQQSAQNDIQPPADLPDFEKVERAKSEFSEEWSRRRPEILNTKLGLSAEAISALDALTSKYTETKKDLIQRSETAKTLMSPEFFHGITELNRTYRDDLEKLVGSENFKQLESEKLSLLDKYSSDGYSIPNDTF